MTVALRAFPLVGGPVEVRGALDLETTPAGVMPRRLPAWTKEQYQDPSVYGVTVMPSGVRLVFRTDARELEFEVLTGTGQLDSDPHPRPTGMLELVVDGALAGRQQAPVGNVLRMGEAGFVPTSGTADGDPADRARDLDTFLQEREIVAPDQTLQSQRVTREGFRGGCRVLPALLAGFVCVRSIARATAQSAPRRAGRFSTLSGVSAYSTPRDSRTDWFPSRSSVRFA
ncbi:hypothetical protein AB5J55_01130 [Streptomyces sp. R11]|uniref:SsfX3-like N-terminal domain-containing protein n=1 Tax=Streptomyces sp. R11 TaxID=3238625 RepID=A0AB39MQI6_9ACTN